MPEALQRGCVDTVGSICFRWTLSFFPVSWIRFGSVFPILWSCTEVGLIYTLYTGMNLPLTLAACRRAIQRELADKIAGARFRRTTIYPRRGRFVVDVAAAKPSPFSSLQERTKINGEPSVSLPDIMGRFGFAFLVPWICAVAWIDLPSSEGLI